ncbi:MAG: hypothetical protein JW795_00635 [Chitinivibrionales bacterium]|nr:hypothetical protein [Chitinivibrionales bacterium]
MLFQHLDINRPEKAPFLTSLRCIMMLLESILKRKNGTSRCAGQRKSIGLCNCFLKSSALPEPAETSVARMHRHCG